MIEEHNKLANIHGFTLGMNSFGDMTSKEIVAVFNGYIMRPDTNDTSKLFKPHPNFVAKETVDWRNVGAVTPIKNQGQCGSCWAFSTTGSLEGQHFLKSKTLTSLSEQNLMDCSRGQLNRGCEGGLVDRAIEYIVMNRGIDTEMSYPYQAHDEVCRFKANGVGATASGYKDIKRGSISDLVEACTRIGPISVAMDASGETFHFYKSGIFQNVNCSTSLLDHAVLLVGYGTSSSTGEDYWLVKNSWGASWGMDGFFMISRKDNMCGLATQASYPLL